MIRRYNKMKLTNLFAMKQSNLIFVFALLIFFTSCDDLNQRGTISQRDNTITISGEVELTNDLEINEGEILFIEPGSIVRLGNNVRIKINGKIIAKGTVDNPIIFESKGEEVYWRGIKIEGLEDIPATNKFWTWLETGDKKTEEFFFTKINTGNTFEYCTFRNLATKTQDFKRKNKWKGSIEAYNTSLRVSHCTFEDILFFGGILSQRSYVVVNDCTFDDESIHKAINSTDRAVGLFYDNYIEGHRDYNTRCADGIWTKQFVGLIANNIIKSTGDDGIDTDGSRVVIYNNKVSGSQDDGIDIDNKGLCYIIDNEVDNVNENGILISDESNAICVRNTIKNSPNGLTLRDGAEVVSEEMNIHDNGNGVILFQNIPGLITINDFKRIQEEINGMTVDEIYENEYISGVEGPEDLIKLLDDSYNISGDYWEFNRSGFEQVSELDDLKKVFKIVDVFEMEYVSTDMCDNPNPIALNKALKNGIFLSSASIKNNGKDIALFHDYNIKIEDSEFTDEAAKDKILSNCKCDKNHKCEIIDKLNTSGVEINSKKVIGRITNI